MQQQPLIFTCLLLVLEAADPCFQQTGVVFADVEGTSFPVLCDSATDGGGWVVILERKDGSVDFGAPSWNDYAHSQQGQLSGEFFLALDHLHLLTKDAQMELLVTMRKDSDSRWAYYDTFAVGAHSTKYRLTVSGYDTGSSAGNSFTYHSGMKWSAPDQDNDSWSSVNCAAIETAAWWHRACTEVGLLKVFGQAIEWESFSVNLDTASMRIRPARCQTGPGLNCSQCKPGFFLCTSPISGRTSCCDQGISSCQEATATGLWQLTSGEPVYCDAEL